MLELRGVSKRFTGIPAVDDVSFSPRAGEVTGYLGPNGSGKSTTMKMITGLIEPTAGEILFNGRADPARPDRVQTAPRLRSRRATFVFASHRPGVSRHGGAAARSAGIRRLRRLMGFCVCSRCMEIATCRFRLTRKVCGRRSCWLPRCCIIRICCCWTSLFPDSTSVRRWFCAV